MAKVKGGKKLKHFLAMQKKAQGRMVKAISVGFFASAKYDDGTPVTNVAAWNEFGTRIAPARPFMSQSIEVMKSTLPSFIKKRLKPEALGVDPVLAEYIGMEMQTVIQDTIRDGTFVENAESTKAVKEAKAKKIEDPDYPGARPLIDTGFMRMSVTYRVYTVRKPNE